MNPSETLSSDADAPLLAHPPTSAPPPTAPTSTSHEHATRVLTEEVFYVSDRMLYYLTSISYGI
jgi:hypothetical protein